MEVLFGYHSVDGNRVCCILFLRGGKNGVNISNIHLHKFQEGNDFSDIFCGLLHFCRAELDTGQVGELLHFGDRYFLVILEEWSFMLKTAQADLDQDL